MKLIKKLYSNIWFRTILFIGIFLGFYAIRENINITNNTRTILNLVLMGVFFVQFYQRLNEKRISIVRFLFILVAVFILNKFYDSNIFFDIFKIRLIYAVAITDSVIFLYIIGSKIFNLIKNKKEADSKLKDNSTKVHDKDAILIDNRNDFAANEESQIYPNKNTEREIHANEKKIKSQTGVTILIILIILLFSILSVVPLFNENMRNKLTSIETNDSFSVYISLIGLFFLCIFMWAVVVTVFIRLGQIILNIIKYKDSQNNYLLNGSAFLVVSYFITKQYNISLDKILDSIIQGNILSFPMLILILLPLFFTLLQNLETLIKKNGEIKEKTANLISKLIFGIIEALLNFIKFTTADFLTSIQDIVKEDLNYEAETKKTSDEDLGERIDGEARNQSKESE